MTDKLMSASDIERVTGKKRYSKQVEWFLQNYGVRVVCSANGSPVMPWATFQALNDRNAKVLHMPTQEERPALRSIR